MMTFSFGFITVIAQTRTSSGLSREFGNLGPVIGVIAVVLLIVLIWARIKADSTRE